MDEIKIEKGVPIPLPSHARYPWRSMNVGDSFFVPLTKHAKLSTLQSNLSACIHNTRSINIKIRTKQDKKNNGVRVWRIA